MTVRLYGNRYSGHSWKVRQALVLLGVQHEYAPVDLAVAPAMRRPDFVALSPFGEVPILVVGERVYAQSNAILLMLNREAGALMGGSLEALERWLFWEANRIGFSAGNLRWQCRFEPAAQPGVIAMLRARTKDDLDTLEAHLSGNDFILGQELTLADLSCSAYLNFADECELCLRDWPSVAAWMNRISDTRGWEHPYDLMDDSRAAVRPAEGSLAPGQKFPFPRSLARHSAGIRLQAHRVNDLI